MSFLHLLWVASLVLSLVALAIMSALILVRMAIAKKEDERDAERKRQVPIMLGSEQPSPVEGAMPDLLADLTLEMIQLVRGEERESFVRKASELGVPDQLRDRLATGGVRTRLAAAEALRYFPDPASIAALTAALEDPNPDVRLSAALSLAAEGAAPPAPELVETLKIGSDEHSLLSVTLLREIAADKPEEVKALVLDPATLPPVKAAAIEALVTTGDYSLVKVISDLALGGDDKSEEMPRFMRALADFAHPAGAAAVMKGLHSDQPAVRALAAKAAGRIGLPEAADRLAELLDDEDWWVRFRAGRALLKLGTVGEVRLQDAAGSGSDRAKESALTTLAERSQAA